MAPFPDSLSVLVVEDLYDNYDLAFEDGAEDVHVYCERCDDIVCVLDYGKIADDDELDLYELIVERHRPL